MASSQKSTTASDFLNPLAQHSRRRKRQRQSSPSDVLSDDLPLPWSSSPSPPIRTGDKKQTTCQPRGNACQDLAKFGPRSRQVPIFQPILIRGEIEKIAKSFPPARSLAAQSHLGYFFRYFTRVSIHHHLRHHPGSW